MQKAVEVNLDKWGFKDDVEYVYQTGKGLNESVVREISKLKGEPEWMLKFRLRALKHFLSRPTPKWGPDLSRVNFDDIIYYMKPTGKNTNKWENVPEEIKKTFERIGVPQAEREFLSGSGAQYDSETVYHNIRDDLSKKGVIFTDIDTALKEHPELFKKFFSTVVPVEDNKFAALNSAVWSGGSFLYVPKNVHVELPLQAYFRINAQNVGQFERTLIVVDEGASAHYLESCTAPIYSENSLHAAVVEVIALPNSKVRYTTVQNWSKNVFNLVTKRAVAHKNATVEWVDANLGAAITMKYPSVYMIGEGARADILSVAYASKGQVQDTGAKAVHLAPNTHSTILAKSISKDGGVTVYRGLLQIAKGAVGCKSHVRCDALLLDKESKSDTIPYMDIQEQNVSIGHEATIGKISEEQLFYLMSRGLTESQSIALIVRGFVEFFTKKLPLDYAIEMNKLIEFEMEGAIG